jgi:hypothetical protein
MRRPFLLLSAAAGALLLGGSLHAHHSYSVFDAEHPITLKGVVTEFLFANPHARIRFDVKDADGNVEQWIAESASPFRLTRAGWNRKSLKPGDKIVITGAPARDGRKVLNNRKLVAPSGQVLDQGAD